MKSIETELKKEMIKAGMNRAYLYYAITREKIEKMPFKKIGENLAMQKTKSKYWNPVHFYPMNVRTQHNEIGHDRSTRYILKGNPKN